MSYTTGIFIGRFQPVHLGHIQALSRAAAQVNHLQILVGSANKERNIKNPWTYSERKQALSAKLESFGIHNATIAPLNDHPYSDSQWISDVRNTVQHTLNTTPILFGHMKEGNNYLSWFPDWEFRGVDSSYDVNATSVRQQMFKNNDPSMPKTVRDDWAFYQKEAERFKDYPFPETLNFNCSDAVVECQGHVLLIRRKFAPGAGQWALPGGFRNQRETFLDCALRELQEETNIRVPEKVLRGGIVKTELFDSPDRSFGIPRNTLAVYIRISPDPGGTLPRANGADDAAECKWFPLSTIMNGLPLYDDHAAIISKMTGVIPNLAVHGE
jgi:bifunctional NMN adenylyltransferase/nudix hydrolase